MFRNELLSKEWCNLVFEGRNQDYGAYQLRKRAGRRYRTAFLALVLIVVPLFVIPAAVSAFIGNQIRQMRDDMDIIAKLKPLNPNENREVKVIAAGRSVPRRNAPKGDRLDVPELTEAPPQELAFGLEVPQSVETGEEVPVSVPRDTLHNVRRTDLPEEGRLLLPQEVVEEMPQFPGGLEALVRFFDANVDYPESAIRAKKRGRLEVTFLVDAEGNVTEPALAKSLSPELDRAALAACRKMPRWTPGRSGGRVTIVRVTVPICFELD